MVSNASELLPDPDNPVRTTSLSRGMSMSMFLRLCSRAPRTLIRSCRAMKQRSSLGALGICGDSSEQTIVICQCSICRARRSGVSIHRDLAPRDDNNPLRCELYQSNRTDSSLIPNRLIMASGSPRRVALLGELGVPFETVVSNAPETIDLTLGPEAQAVALAKRKARVVASQRETGIVLGADTIVELDGEMLGKPGDEADATRMLRRLRGREHRVVTGIAVVDSGTGALRTSAVSSSVRIRTLSDEEID